MTNRALLATAALSFAIVSPLFAGGHGHHHQNMGHAFKGAHLNFNDEQLLQTIARDERTQLFNDANVTKSKGTSHHNNQVIWANSGPDCLVAPVQTSSSINGGNASRLKGTSHHSNQVTWASSGPDCLVAPVQSSGSINSGNVSKSSRHEKSNGRGR